jgi:Membrane-fusion protein
MKAIKTSVGLLLAAMVMVAGCSRPQQDDPRTQPPLVRVTTVSDRSAGEQSFTGVVTARVQSDLGFRVPGKVIGRFVDVGQTVRARQSVDAHRQHRLCARDSRSDGERPGRKGSCGAGRGRRSPLSRPGRHGRRFRLRLRPGQGDCRFRPGAVSRGAGAGADRTRPR